MTRSFARVPGSLSNRLWALRSTDCSWSRGLRSAQAFRSLFFEFPFVDSLSWLIVCFSVDSDQHARCGRMLPCNAEAQNRSPAIPWYHTQLHQRILYELD